MKGLMKETGFFCILYGMKSMPLLLASEKVLHRRTVVALQEQFKKKIALYSTWNDLYKNYILLMNLNKLIRNIHNS